MATVGDAFDDVGHFVGFEFVCADVVEKEEWFCSLNYHVVYVHCDDVDADGVVDFEVDSEFDFRADAVRAAYENGVFVVTLEEFFVVVKSEASRECAVGIEYARAVCSLHVSFDFGDHFVAGVDIDAAFGVCHMLCCHVRIITGMRR